MKILITIFVFTFAFISGQAIKPIEIEITNDSIIFYKEDFEKNLSKEIVPKEIEITYYLINNTESAYAVFVDTNKFLVYETTDTDKYFTSTECPLSKQTLQQAIIIKDSANRITDTGFSIYGNYFNKLPKIDSFIEAKMILMKPFSKRKLKTKISMPILNNNLGKGVFSSQYFMGISLDGIQSGKFSIILIQNKNIINKALNKNIKKHLNKEKINIYDGKIESNEVPIIVK